MSVDPTVTFAGAARPADGVLPGAAGGGAAGSRQIRISERAWFDDGTGAGTVDGADRPNPRAISNAIFKQTDAGGAHIDMPNESGFSSLLWVWGQFLDHDLDQTFDASGSGTAPIAIPDGDPMRDQGITQLNFNRSTPMAGTGTSGVPREYANQITSFIDGSNLYGSDQAKLNAILVPGTAKLRLSSDGTILFNQNDGFFGAGFVTGDTRAGENIALLSMHALFAREHNRIVDELNDAAAAQGLTLTVAQQFEGARARVEAIMQAITYNEFLPKLIGDGALDDYTGHKAGVNPAISLEFSTAIYRLGHTLLSPTIARMNEDGTTDARGNIALRDAFQVRGVVELTGIEDILRGMSTTRSQELDTFVVEDVRSFLFNTVQGSFGSDLAALNIQRGRDHGLPTLNELRVALGLDAYTNFSQITSDATLASRLATVYGNVGRVDLWVGGLAEDSVAGGMVGETFRAVLIDQFIRLRDGDPFWSQGRGFSQAELAELWSTTLSDVITRNGDVRDLQDDAFVAYTRIAGTNAGETINGGAGRNLIIGNGGADNLRGNTSDDHIVGGAGNDRLNGLGGENVLIGGDGNDTYIFNVALATFTRVRGWESNDVFQFNNTAGAPPRTVVDTAAGAVVTFGAATILVEGVTAAELPFGGATNTAPNVAADTASVTVNGSVQISVLANDTDNGTIDVTSVQLAGADAGSNGRTRTVAGEGVWTVNASTGVVTFTPAAGYAGPVTAVSYTVADTLGLRSGPATINVTITGGNTAPTARDDAANVAVNGSGTIAVLANDTDNGALDPASVQLVDADHGSNGRTRTVAGEGVWTVNPTTGALTFAPVANFTGPVTSAQYTVADTTGLRSAAAEVDVTLTGGLNPGQTLNGNRNANTLNGGAGNDTINGGGGIDTISGAGGADTLNGGTGRDIVDGGGGADVILIRAGEAATDTMNGGTGLADTIRVVAAGGTVTLNGTGGISGVEIFEGSGQTIRGSDVADVFDFSIFAAVRGVAAIEGRGGADTILGSDGGDVIRGGTGNDSLNGGRGDDVLTGGSNNDTFRFVAGGVTSGVNTITDFDQNGNDVLRFVNYSFGVANPGGLTNGQRAAIVGQATTFDAGGATVDLVALGGEGSIRLLGVTTASLTFNIEDVVFG